MSTGLGRARLFTFRSPGTRCFSSSVQCSTTTMLTGMAFGSPSALSLDHQEPLAIRRHIVVAGGIWFDILVVEHLRRLACAECRPGHLDRHRGQRVRSIKVEKLAPASRPGRTRPTSVRHLPAAVVHLRERPHIDLEPARLTGLVRDIATVRREIAEPSIEPGLGGWFHQRRAESRSWTGPRSAHWRRQRKKDDVGVPPGQVVKAGEPSPVRRDRRRPLRVRACRQPVDGSRAVGGLAVQVPHARCGPT